MTFAQIHHICRRRFLREQAAYHRNATLAVNIVSPYLKKGFKATINDFVPEGYRYEEAQSKTWVPSTEEIEEIKLIADRWARKDKNNQE